MFLFKQEDRIVLYNYNLFPCQIDNSFFSYINYVNTSDRTHRAIMRDKIFFHGVLIGHIGLIKTLDYNVVPLILLPGLFC